MDTEFESECNLSKSDFIAIINQKTKLRILTWHNSLSYCIIQIRSRIIVDRSSVLKEEIAFIVEHLAITQGSVPRL
jgi:hypothetical protein